MVAATLKRTLVSILILIGSGLWVAALLIMAQTVQQSAHFSDLHPFIVGVNVAGLLVLLDSHRRPSRAAGARLAQTRRRLASRSAHGVDVGDARDGAAVAGVLFLRGVPQPRHRQLVPRRDSPGIGRRADACHARRSICACANIWNARARSRLALLQCAAVRIRSSMSCVERMKRSSSRCSHPTAASSRPAPIDLGDIVPAPVER